MAPPVCQETLPPGEGPGAVGEGREVVVPGQDRFVSARGRSTTTALVDPAECVTLKHRKIAKRCPENISSVVKVLNCFYQKTFF